MLFLIIIGAFLGVGELALPYMGATLAPDLGLQQPVRLLPLARPAVSNLQEPCLKSRSPGAKRNSFQGSFRAVR